MRALTAKALLSCCLALQGGSVRADCFAMAAGRYQLSEALLRAIALVESHNNPRALHTNANGSVDIGLMQVNSSHLERLASYGIQRHDLYEPCTNIMVGAWVLALNMQRYGQTWRAVGSYNAGLQPKRDAVRIRYVSRVRPMYLQLRKTANSAAAQAALQPREPTP